MEPSALRFLTRHGFDFNRHVHSGLPYTPAGGMPLPGNAAAPTPAQGNRGRPPLQGTGGNDKAKQAAGSEREELPRLLFRLLATLRCPLVVHNGWVDLLFLYHHFFAPLPPTLDEFLACLADVLPPIVDTKYLSEYAAREPASFLEYLFRRQQRHVLSTGSFQLVPMQGLAALRRQCPGAVLTVPLTYRRSQASLNAVRGPFSARSIPIPSLAPLVGSPSIQTTHSFFLSLSRKDICEQYARHGHCRGMDGECVRVHDLEAILDVEELETRKKAVLRAAKRALRRSGGDEGGTPEKRAALDGKEGGAAGQEANEPSASLAPGEGRVAPAVDSGATTQAVPLPPQPRTQGHRAGFDAFMTAFVYLSYRQERPVSLSDGHEANCRVTVSKEISGSSVVGSNCPFLFSLCRRMQEEVEAALRKLYITGRDLPLLVSRECVRLVCGVSTYFQRCLAARTHRFPH
jgi:hypothetical protein